jgi:hypothetical protein
MHITNKNRRGFNIITKNYREELFDHEDKGTKTHRNVYKYSPDDKVSVTAEDSKDRSSYFLWNKQPRPL